MADPTDNAAHKALVFAQAQLGKPYRWGFTGPNYYDCSGLVQAAFAAGGVKLPRTTYEQINVGQAVSRNDLQPGDLVFPDRDHVQIVISNNSAAGVFVIEAPHTGANVRIARLGNVMAARRVTAPANNIGDPVQRKVESLASSGFDQLQTQIEKIPGVKQVETLGTVLEKLSDPQLWARIGIGAVGVFLIIAGITLVGKRAEGALITGGKL